MMWLSYYVINEGALIKVPYNWNSNLPMLYNVDAYTCYKLVMDSSLTFWKSWLSITDNVDQNIPADQKYIIHIHQTFGEPKMKYIQLLLNSSTIVLPDGPKN